MINREPCTGLGRATIMGTLGGIQDALVPLLFGTEALPGSPKTGFKGGGVTAAGPGRARPPRGAARTAPAPSPLRPRRHRPPSAPGQGTRRGGSEMLPPAFPERPFPARARGIPALPSPAQPPLPGEAAAGAPGPAAGERGWRRGRWIPAFPGPG